MGDLSLYGRAGHPAAQAGVMYAPGPNHHVSHFCRATQRAHLELSGCDRMECGNNAEWSTLIKNGNESFRYVTLPRDVILRSVMYLLNTMLNTVFPVLNQMYSLVQ